MRLIAVGETLRRLVGKMMIHRVRDRASSLLKPTQLGVAIPGGAEAIIHTTRHLVDEHGHDDRLGLLKIDFRNAFNLANRLAMERAVRMHFPELLSYVRMCYILGMPHLWCGNMRMRSATGCQQGDPLGPLLFCLVLYDLLSLSPGRTADENDENLPFRMMFYMDDGVIVGPHRDLQRIISFLGSPLARAHGIFLQASKCELWWPTSPPTEVRSEYPAEIVQIFTPGTMVMQAPIGSPSFVVESLVGSAQAMQPLLSAISEIEDGHVAFTLLKKCASVCRIAYLLRVTPPSLSLPAAKLVDKLVSGALRGQLNGTLPDSLMSELALPVRSEIPTFGIGLTSAEDIASASYLASIISARPLMQNLLPNPSQADIAEHDWVTTAHTDWASRVLPDDRSSLAQLISTEPKQRWLTKLVHRKRISQVDPGTTRRQAHRASLGVVGAKDWLSCPPSPGMGTHIPDRDFRLWLKFHAGMRLFNDALPCPRLGCTETIDPHGDHLLHCGRGVSPRNSPRHWRHNSIVQVLAGFLRQAARNPAVEYTREGQPQRPDITVEGTRGGSDYLDITIIHPLSSLPRCNRVARRPQSAVNKASYQKYLKYKPFLDTGGKEDVLIPVVISTVGGWSKPARDYFQDIANAVSSHGRIPRSFVTSIIFQRVAARLATLNCNSLTEGITISM